MAEALVPNHRIADSFIGQDFATVIIMSRASLFEIQLNREDLRGTALEAQYKRRTTMFTTNDEIISADQDLPDDADHFEDFCDWLIEPCVMHIRQLAPEIQGPITLQQFTFPQLHCMRLLPDGDRLIAKLNEVNSFRSGLPTVPVAKLSLPPSILRVRAAEVSILSDRRGPWDHTCDIPRRVYVTGEEKFFKPIVTSEDFEREILKLSGISKLGLPKYVNVPELFGVVISEDEFSAIGMLLKWMPFGSRTLWNEEFRQMKCHHSTWEKQITDTVKQLHAVDIVWGDVNPGNIVIDPELNAWVVDFGGGFIEEFVEKELAGTKEGDLDGIKKIFHHWIGNPRSVVEPELGTDD